MQGGTVPPFRTTSLNGFCTAFGLLQLFSNKKQCPKKKSFHTLFIQVLPSSQQNESKGKLKPER
jgi:hypothetical protein